MNKRKSILSRRFLIYGSSMAALSLFYLSCVGRGAIKSCSNADDLALPSDFGSLIRIGNSYLKEWTETDELGTPAQMLFDPAEARSAVIVSAVRSRLKELDDQIREEFARSETVTCDGWLLARSEAKLCATVASHFSSLK